MTQYDSHSLGNVHNTVTTENKTGWRKILSFLGPAYLVSVGYMDPGNWATDLAAGSQFGYKLIWVLLLSNLIALLLQNLCVRLGIVRSLDLAQVSKHTYPRFVNFCLYVLAQIAIIACDLAEIIGMAIGLNLLFGLPLIWGVSITLLDTLLLLLLLNKGMRKLEGFIISLIFIVGVAFLVQMFIVQPHVVDIAKGFIPTQLNNEALYIAIGIIGATVMPHNLYLHSSLVQTRKIDRSDEGIRKAITYNFWDTTIALNLAFFVNAAILILAAAAFYYRGYHEVAEIQDAHKLLTSIFGKLAPALFAIALIAAGQSSTVTGTLAGQIIMEGHLNLRIAPWLRRLLTRLLAIIPAFFTILHAGSEGLGKLLILSQVVLSLQLGFAVIPLIHFTSDKKRMGQFANSMPMKIAAWFFAIIIVALNVRLVIQEINDWAGNSPSAANLVHFVITPIAAGIGILLLYVFIRPMLYKHNNQPVYVPHGIAATLDNLEAIQYKQIGITIDFSKNDQDTIRHALMQGGKEADYNLIHVVETAGARYYGKQVMDNETQSDVDNLDKYVDALVKLGYNARAKIGFGGPATAIAQIVRDNKIDFVVMGSHGHKVLKDLIFGTTVNEVRHRVNVPVLIVKPQKNNCIFAIPIQFRMEQNVYIKNKKAYFEYTILDKYVAGIQLLGTEIKSIRNGKANINDAFCTFIGNQLYVRNLHISEYSFGSFYNHEAKRDRVLLLHKKELKKLQTRTEEKGLTIIPLALFISERGFAKLEIGLAQGKKTYDKRESLKERDTKLEMDRAMKR